MSLRSSSARSISALPACLILLAWLGPGAATAGGPGFVRFRSGAALDVYAHHYSGARRFMGRTPSRDGQGLVRPPGHSIFVEPLNRHLTGLGLKALVADIKSKSNNCN